MAPAILQAEVAAMRMVLAIRESSHGLWCISNGTVLIHDKLRFAHAIRLSRAIARAEHDRTGYTIWVEMVCSEFTIDLLKFGPAAPAHQMANGQAELRRDQGKLSAGERNPDASPVRIPARSFEPGSASRLRAVS